MRSLSRCSIPILLAVAVPWGWIQAQSLPGTQPLTYEGDPAFTMVDAINAFLLQKTAESVDRRAALWHRDTSSSEAYERSITPKRERLRKIIGAVDPRLPVKALTLEATTAVPATVGYGQGYKILAVRWPVFDDVEAAGLLLQPNLPQPNGERARVIVVPDADWSPEMLSGLAPGLPPSAQIARRLAENGCQVLIPAIIDRRSTWSGIPGVKMTNLSHREWIYRMAFEAGRHIIGYEVQEVLAAVDWFEHENITRPLPVAAVGYGEGGLVALYAAALDPRIGTTLVSGYFQSRNDLWQDPIYRDVWGLLDDFGDAEIASLIAPRKLIVEASRFPVMSTPPVAAVQKEVARARAFYAMLNAASNLHFIPNGDGQGPPGSAAAITALLASFGIRTPIPMGTPPRDIRPNFDPNIRLHRQFDQLVAHTQAVIRAAPRNRTAFWARADTSSPEQWQKTTQPLRSYIWDEVIGRMPAPSSTINPRTRLIYDTPKFRGYEVMLDVWPGIFDYGILLVPKNIAAGERRPVVVCQHGLEGRSRDVADPNIDSHFYHAFAARLAEQGFITYAPQNPYIGEDRFRQIQRKGHPLKLSIFSFILGQHERLLEWLGSLPFVDAKRIGFYGLSYGGKTAVRVPPLIGGYALSICSADFNEWIWKNTSVDSAYSYLLTPEYDMIEFNLANVANYSDLANLMAPRPFMVERGHEDGVASDEWVAYEYAKVRRFYARMGIGERTEIEFFNGPHTIHGVGTFAFLHRFLHWPE